MKKHTLAPNLIYQKSQLCQKDIATIPSQNPIIGQDDALQALNFGIQMKASGYNIFCTGIKGVGRTTLTRQAVESFAATQKTPDDWCFVHNFEVAHQPIALNFPVGQGKTFFKDMQKMVNALKLNLPPLFSDEMYKIQIAHIAQSINKQKESFIQSVESNITGENVSLLEVQNGITVAPVKKGKILTPKTFNILPKNERKDILSQLNAAQKMLESFLSDAPNWNALLQNEYDAYNIKLAEKVLKSTINPLKKIYAKNNAVLTHIDFIWLDIIDNLHLFTTPLTPKNADFINEQLAELWNKFTVNLFISNKPDSGAPVVHLNHPTLSNLLGRIERQQYMGSLITDFSLIRPGALHQANGGYLIIDAKELLANANVWNALKRSLFSKQIKIESAGDDSSIFSVVSLMPGIIPLSIKVILIGEAPIYYALMEQDDEFTELFKIQSRYNDKMPRTRETEIAYANILLTFAKKEKLKPFDLSAMNRLLECAARYAGDKEKLTTCMVHINDIMREAHFIATKKRAKIITKTHINQALFHKESRESFMQQDIMEMIEKNIISIDTTSKKVGQLNALVVHEYGASAFGRPNRVSCQVYLGHGDLIDIERQVELGGALHSKGVLILSAFLSGRFATKTPLCLDASLTFEQSYSELDGDSASSTELYCLLSAIGNIPLNQAIATTGSVNQMGQIQSVGGVNEKIEGFFDICQARGLDGTHGVIIPACCQQSLMLKPAIVQAVNDNLFTIYAINTIDEGMAILSGKPAGTKDKSGTYPLKSINGIIEKCIHTFFTLNQTNENPTTPAKPKKPTKKGT